MMPFTIGLDKHCYNVIILTESVLIKIKITIITYSWKNVHVNKINMLYYDRFGISEGIDVNKTSASKSVIFVTIGIF